MNMKLLMAVPVCVFIMAFKSNPSAERFKPGVYGTCSTGSPKIELTINEDFTFTYFDNISSSQPIEIKGNWVHDGNAILLKNYSSEFPLAQKWRMDKNEKCIKSREGLEFNRLCSLQP